ncbi:hypothetical protein BH11ACT2_BH11ACT2_05740 [soil metagenome]
MPTSEPPLDPDALVRFDTMLTREPAERRRVIRDELNLSTRTFRLHLRDAASDPQVQAEHPDATRRILHRLDLDEFTRGS